MRRRLFVGIALCLGIALTLFLAAPSAQEKESKSSATKAKETRLEGNVHMINAKTNTITVTVTGTPGTPAQKEVVYNDKTKFTFRNKASSAEEVKEGRRVIILGTSNDKMQLIATRVEIRDAR